MAINIYGTDEQGQTGVNPLQMGSFNGTYADPAQSAKINQTKMTGVTDTGAIQFDRQKLGEDINEQAWINTQEYMRKFPDATEEQITKYYMNQAMIITKQTSYTPNPVTGEKSDIAPKNAEQVMVNEATEPAKELFNVGIPHYMRVAHEYLADGVRLMYSDPESRLVLLGSTHIRPLDVIFIADFDKGIFGPIEAKAVHHSFNAAEGLVTSILPQAIVSCNCYMSTDDVRVFGKFFSSFLSFSWWALGIGTAVTSVGVGLTAGFMSAGLVSPLGAAFVGVGAGLLAGYGVLSHGLNVLNTTCRSMLGCILGREPIDVVPLTRWGIPIQAGLTGYRKGGFIFELVDSVRGGMSQLTKMGQQ